MKKALLIVLLVPFLMAQHSVELSRVRIDGFVRDHGKPVPNVQVMARSNADRQTTRTDSKGHFVFFSLAAGVYRVSADEPGLQTCIPAHVETQAGYHYTADISVGKTC